MRGREERRRESRFNDALKYNYSLEDKRRGLEWLIEGLEETKQEVPRTRHNFGRTLAGIQQLERLRPLREEVARVEDVDLDSKIRVAAPPESAVVEKLVRYEMNVERDLDCALERLERMQKRRRENHRDSPKAPEAHSDDSLFCETKPLGEAALKPHGRC